MPDTTQSGLRAAASRLGWKRSEKDERLHANKTRAIDHLFRRLDVRSFADLGGVWIVEGGYSFHVLEHQAIERAVLVDERSTEPFGKRGERFPQLELLRGDFTESHMAERVGEVDAVLLFDVLLHQVYPNWDEVLSLYAPRTRAFVVAQPQYVGGPTTIRLPDLGKEQYLKTAPPLPIYDELLDKLDEVDPASGRRYRDVRDIWQWGIVDRDLVAALERLGFALAYYEDAGPWEGLSTFNRCSFVFLRR